MYRTNPLTGVHLPEKTLCLTYDDGPGEHTLPIARFLHQQGIRAAFFVVGKYAIHHTGTLAALQQMNHIVANHTFEHPDLPYYHSINGDIQSQVVRTDAVIKNYINGPVYFRAPYGKWSAAVAEDLNQHLSASLHHIGPVYWDIGGVDCHYWQQGKTVTEALEAYLISIRQQRKGIVVMHDAIADMDAVQSKNKTFELTQLLIPALLQEGYRFVGLDEVPGFQLSEPASFIYLKKTGGNYLTYHEKQRLITATGKTQQASAVFTLLDTGSGTIAFQTANHCFLSETREKTIVAISTTMDETCIFHLVPVFANRYIFRSRSGHFLTINKRNELTTDAAYMRLATIFMCVEKGTRPMTLPVGLRLSILVKKLQFIKMKLKSRF